jgi:hypothetical protein
VWLPWQYSIWLAVAFAVATLAMRVRVPPRRWLWPRELTQESAIFATLYTIWQWVGHLPTEDDRVVATARGVAIARVERVLHLPSEHWTQQVALHSHLVIKAANWYYIVGHTPVLAVFLLWLYVRHRGHFARWRTALAVGCILGELIQIIAVAPPRFALSGMIDTGQVFGPAVYESSGAGFAPQLGAMPSLHCVWAVTVGAAVFALAGRGWRWVGPAHVALTVLTVTVTGNHYWLDAIAGGALVLPGLAIYDSGTRLRRRWQRQPTTGEPWAAVLGRPQNPDRDALPVGGHHTAGEPQQRPPAPRGHLNSFRQVEVEDDGRHPAAEGAHDRGSSMTGAERN